MERGRDRLLTTVEVAKLFAVNPKTVSRWAAEGKLEGFKTPGGMCWRFHRSYILSLLNGSREDLL